MAPYWWRTKDGDVDCLAMVERHYPPHKGRKSGRRVRQFVGPGEAYVMRSDPYRPLEAVFVWRKFKDDCIDQRTGDRQQGVNCAVFRNEGAARSSELIRQADAVADHCWSDRRHYTYVDPEKVKSANPGFCFIAAGWRRCGRTKGGLIVLERDTTHDVASVRQGQAVGRG
jgi:hypothetical protein